MSTGSGPAGADGSSARFPAAWWPIIGLALAARVAWALVVPTETTIGDSVAYNRFAHVLASGGGYGWNPGEPSAYWPPGTSYVYSLLYRLVDVDRAGYWPVTVLNIAMGVLVVVLGTRLARRWFGERAAVVAGVLLALWPIHIEFTTLLASELLFTAAMLLGLDTWPQSFKPGRLVIAGLAFAAATYMRPTALLIPPVLAAADVIRRRRIRLPSASLAVVVVVMGLAIAPWAMRNQGLLGKPILISCNGGSNLWMGNHPGTTGEYQELPARPPDLSEAQFDQKLRDEAVAYIKAEPFAFAKRTVIKAIRFHDRETGGVRWNFEDRHSGTIFVVKWIGQTYWLAVLCAGLVGVGLLVRREGLIRACGHPAVAVWAYFTAVHAVIVIQDRYHFPITPLVGALAATVIAPLVVREPKEAV